MAWLGTAFADNAISFLGFDSVPIMFHSVLMLAIKRKFSTRVIPLSRDAMAKTKPRHC
jgi:hypothetical protein